MNDLDTFSRGLGGSNYSILLDLKNLPIRYRITSNDNFASRLIVTNCFVSSAQAVEVYLVVAVEVGW
jgi:hypothetical protein